MITKLIFPIFILSVYSVCHGQSNNKIWTANLEIKMSSPLGDFGSIDPFAGSISTLVESRPDERYPWLLDRQTASFAGIGYGAGINTCGEIMNGYFLSLHANYLIHSISSEGLDLLEDTVRPYLERNNEDGFHRTDSYQFFSISSSFEKGWRVDKTLIKVGPIIGAQFMSFPINDYFAWSTDVNSNNFGSEADPNSQLTNRLSPNQSLVTSFLYGGNMSVSYLFPGFLASVKVSYEKSSASSFDRAVKWIDPRGNRDPSDGLVIEQESIPYEAIGISLSIGYYLNK